MKETRKITLSAMFLALGLLLPFVTMNIPSIGKMLLPMHIPILLCGFIVGPFYGATIGFITPLLRSFIFGAPYFYPDAVMMSFELLTYGLISGVIYHIIFNRRSKLINIYISLILAMIFGRIIYGIVYLIISFISLNEFTFNIFIMEAFINAIPGIIIQLILIPIIIKLLGGYKYVK